METGRWWSLVDMTGSHHSALTLGSLKNVRPAPPWLTKPNEAASGASKLCVSSNTPRKIVDTFGFAVEKRESHMFAQSHFSYYPLLPALFIAPIDMCMQVGNGTERY
jgi:hypothetical protein